MLPSGVRKNNQFTQKEIAQIMAGQMLLWGPPAVPLSQWVVDQAMDYLGKTMVGMSPEETAAWNQGLSGLAQQMFFDVQLDTSDRMALLSGVKDIYRKFADEGNITEFALNAFGSVGNRFFEAAKAVNHGFQYELSDVDMEGMDWKEWQHVAEEIASITSTFSNASKAYWANRTGMWSTKAGQPLVAATETETFWQLLGFSPAKVAQYYDFKYDEEMSNQLVADAKAAIIEANKRYLSGDRLPSRETQRQLTAVIQFYVRNLPPALQRRAIEGAMETLDSTPEWETARQRFYDRIVAPGDSDIREKDNQSVFSTRSRANPALQDEAGFFDKVGEQIREQKQEQ